MLSDCPRVTPEAITLCVMAEVRRGSKHRMKMMALSACLIDAHSLWDTHASLEIRKLAVVWSLTIYFATRSRRDNGHYDVYYQLRMKTISNKYAGI